MSGIVLFAVGSALAAEYEETCVRLGVKVAAWIRNRPGKVYCSDPSLLMTASALAPAVKALPFLCPLFTPGNRRIAAAEALALALSPAKGLLDPTSVVARAVEIGEGSYVNASVTIGAAARIGRHVVINRSASVGHHAEIGDYVSIGPGVILAGEVRVGEGAMLGAGCIILPGKEIGPCAVVGAGSVVTQDVPPSVLVHGNPARVVRRD